MKKIYNILLFPFLLLLLSSCSDKDKNPWLGNIEAPEPIKRLTVIQDAELGSLQDGITVLNDSTAAFVLYAPGKGEVHWASDFTFWDAKRDFNMNKDGDRFWIQIRGFEPTKEYAFQYLIDDSADDENKKVRVADPYSTKVTTKLDHYISEVIYPNMYEYPKAAKDEIATVFTTNPTKYNWKVESFKLENPNNMIVYEMLLRDFTEAKSIKGAQEKIPYLKELGINVIELMPFNEFEGNESWGYNPSFYFAVDKAYGTENAYKEFIDECHANGIAVVMDMVLNHAYGECPLVRMYLDKKAWKVTIDNPWFNVESPNTDYSWGYDFNHESQTTKDFVDRVTKYWLTEYKLDGFRFDFTKGFTNTKGNGWDYDASRIAILKRMTDAIHTVNADAVVIFEHLTDNKEETELANHGIYLWGNMNERYNQTTMGWDNNDLTWTYYKTRGWTKPSLISYMESHDEERLMFKNLAYGNNNEAANGYDVKNLNTALSRSAAAAMIYFTIPGPKMIWQFGELGYDYELNNDRLAPKPVRWDYLDVPERKAVHDVYASMLKLKKENSAFTSDNVEMSVGEGLFKQVLLKAGTGNICAVANFDVVPQTQIINFGAIGEWTDHFTKNKINVTSSKQQMTLLPGEYHLYIKK